MLRLCTLLLLMFATAASAQDDAAHDALRRPERLTVAINDQFLGQFAPDGKTLYFVSNQDTRKEIFVQDHDEARSRRVFDEAADVTWPRLSPDGRRLLYISFSEQATGRLCVRNLPEGDERRCLAGAPAALQAEWLDNQRIVLVARTSIDGNLQLSEVKVAKKKLSSRTLFDRNWTNPAVTPDGRWLVYVPLDRMATRVGPGFAARTAGRLEAIALDRQSAPVPLDIDLPGTTGQPAFAADGRFLYFTQFFSDSNHDGMIDATDHGVLFRVPFEPGATDAPARAAAQQPLQLTDSGWNCQYPAPAALMLLSTCSRGRDLDVYELPLDGQVPTSWSKERLRTELSMGGRREEQLLLYRQALGRAIEPEWRRLLTMRLVMAHLELEEFDAAEFYARKVKALKDPSTRGIGGPLLVLVAQRRARSDRERGRNLERFADDAHVRLSLLQDVEYDSPAARILNRVVSSEVLDSLGDKGAAVRALQSVNLEGDVPRTVLEAYYVRADALYRELDDRNALLAVGRSLATRSTLAPEVQLDYARDAARALTRGLPTDAALAALVREHAGVSSESELGFALDLTHEVLTIRPGKPEPELRARMIALYEAQTRPDRKRAIVLEAVQRAADIGADWTLECLSERYVNDVPQGSQERRRAERLYKRAIMGRAFRHVSRGRLAEARADFDAVYRKTDALESLVESIGLRLQAGMSPQATEAELAPAAGASAASGRFMHAYLIAHALPRLHGEAHAAALEEARATLRDAWGELKAKGPARTLAGAIMHEQFLSEADYAAAETANAQYTVALELSQSDPRYQATLLGQLGLLHTAVGNFRIALDYLEQRERFPYGDDVQSVAVQLATARARLHVGQDEASARSAEAALQTVERVPALAPYRVLSLDRAALSAFAARQFTRALALYDLEVPLLADDARPESRRNRFVVRLARAAAALGTGQPARTLADLDSIDASLNSDSMVELLTPEHVTQKQVRESYGTIAAGLRANAQLSLGQLALAGRALERQQELFARSLKTSEREEDARALTMVEARLAANANARQDPQAASKYLGLALAHADVHAAHLQVPVDTDQLHVLKLSAELHALEKVPVSFDLTARLRDGHSQLMKLKQPAYRSYERWFEVYLALTKLDPPRPAQR